MLTFDGGHWYRRDGSPCFQVRNKPVTLSVAKKMGLLPSVTSILDIVKDTGLEIWKQRKLVTAACENADGQYDDIVQLAMWESNRALQLGNVYHNCLEKMIPAFEKHIDLLEYISWANENLEIEFPTETSNALYEWYRNMGFKYVTIEKTFAAVEGYGGMIDLIAKRGREIWIIDWKTQGTNERSIRYYKKWAVQLAAYAHGVGLPNARIANVVASTTDPGKIGIKEWTQQGSVEYWYEIFRHLFEVWKSPLCSGYDVLSTEEQSEKEYEQGE